MTALTTEHFTLQGARSSTVAESSARAALYVGALSSVLVALGFVGGAARFGSAFEILALVTLPTLYVLGVFTFVRLVSSSVEDLYYGRAINRIRSFYLQHAGADKRYFLLGGRDDPYGVLANMGIGTPSRWQLFFTLGSMVAVINSVVGGATVALLLGMTFGFELGLATAAGVVVAGASLAAHLRAQRRMHASAATATEALFPSP